MFWDYGTVFSKIDQLLENEDSLELEELFEEEDLLQELKTNNFKLINFLSKSDVIAKLLDYLVSTPDESLPDDIRFKNSNLACGILSFGIRELFEVILADNSLMSVIFDYYKQDDLNVLLTNMVTRVLVSFFTEFPMEMLDLINSNHLDFIPNLVKHLDQLSIVELLIKLQSSFMGQSRVHYLNYLVENQMVELLIDRVTHKESEDVLFNASEVILGIVKCANTKPSIFEDFSSDLSLVVVSRLHSDELIKKLLENMFPSSDFPIEKHNSCILYGTMILNYLFNPSLTIDIFFEDITNPRVIIDNQSISYNTDFRVVADYLANFKNYLVRLSVQQVECYMRRCLSMSFLIEDQTGVTDEKNDSDQTIQVVESDEKTEQVKSSDEKVEPIESDIKVEQEVKTDEKVEKVEAVETAETITSDETQFKVSEIDQNSNLPTSVDNDEQKESQLPSILEKLSKNKNDTFDLMKLSANQKSEFLKGLSKIAENISIKSGETTNKEKTDNNSNTNENMVNTSTDSSVNNSNINVEDVSDKVSQIVIKVDEDKNKEKSGQTSNENCWGGIDDNSGKNAEKFQESQLRTDKFNRFRSNKYSNISRSTDTEDSYASSICSGANFTCDSFDFSCKSDFEKLEGKFSSRNTETALCQPDQILRRQSVHCVTQIVSLLTNFMLFGNKVLDVALIDNHIPNLLLDLFQSYSWNNLIHNNIYRVIMFILNDVFYFDYNTNLASVHTTNTFSLDATQNLGSFSTDSAVENDVVIGESKNDIFSKFSDIPRFKESSNSPEKLDKSDSETNQNIDETTTTNTEFEGDTIVDDSKDKDVDFSNNNDSDKNPKNIDATENTTDSGKSLIRAHLLKNVKLANRLIAMVNNQFSHDRLRCGYYGYLISIIQRLACLNREEIFPEFPAITSKAPENDQIGDTANGIIRSADQDQSLLDVSGTTTSLGKECEDFYSFIKSEMPKIIRNNEMDSIVNDPYCGISDSTLANFFLFQNRNSNDRNVQFDDNFSSHELEQKLLHMENLKASLSINPEPGVIPEHNEFINSSDDEDDEEQKLLSAMQSNQATDVNKNISKLALADFDFINSNVKWQGHEDLSKVQPESDDVFQAGQTFNRTRRNSTSLGSTIDKKEILEASGGPDTYQTNIEADNNFENDMNIFEFSSVVKSKIDINQPYDFEHKFGGSNSEFYKKVCEAKIQPENLKNSMYSLNSLIDFNMKNGNQLAENSSFDGILFTEDHLMNLKASDYGLDDDEDISKPMPRKSTCSPTQFENHEIDQELSFEEDDSIVFYGNQSESKDSETFQ